jgi:hypothetical protein
VKPLQRNLVEISAQLRSNQKAKILVASAKITIRTSQQELAVYSSEVSKKGDRWRWLRFELWGMGVRELVKIWARFF